MATVDSTFHMTDFELNSPFGEEDAYLLMLWGEGLALELRLDVKDLNDIIREIEGGMRLSEEERKQHQVEELLYQPPEPAPIYLTFCFCELLSLQALYQPPDHLWEMVFEDGEDETQCDIMMSTRQVESLLKRLKEEAVVKEKEVESGN